LANSKDLIKYIKKLKVERLYSTLLETVPLDDQGKINTTLNL